MPANLPTTVPTTPYLGDLLDRVAVEQIPLTAMFL